LRVVEREVSTLIFGLLFIGVKSTLELGGIRLECERCLYLV